MKVKILLGLLLVIALGWLKFVYIIDRPKIWMPTTYKVMSNNYVEASVSRDLIYNPPLKTSTYQNIYHPAYWNVCGCYGVEGGQKCDCYKSLGYVEEADSPARYTFTPYRHKLICEVIK